MHGSRFCSSVQHNAAIGKSECVEQQWQREEQKELIQRSIWAINFWNSIVNITSMKLLPHVIGQVLNCCFKASWECGELDRVVHISTVRFFQKILFFISLPRDDARTPWATGIPATNVVSACCRTPRHSRSARSPGWRDLSIRNDLNDPQDLVVQLFAKCSVLPLKLSAHLIDLGTSR